MPLWHKQEQICLFYLKNAVVLLFAYFIPLYRQVCYVALWIKLCVLAWNSSCQIWSVYKWSMVTETNLYIVQLPNYYFLLIITVDLKVLLFIHRFFQSLVANCRVSAFIKKSCLIGKLDNWTCLFYPMYEIILGICMNKFFFPRFFLCVNKVKVFVRTC
jgi:hypothetical protein